MTRVTKVKNFSSLYTLVHSKLKKNGGGERVRTDDLLRARQALSQLSYTPTFFNEELKMENEKFYIFNFPFYLQNVVGLGGLEPPTSRLSVVRSNQN